MSLGQSNVSMMLFGGTPADPEYPQPGTMDGVSAALRSKGINPDTATREQVWAGLNDLNANMFSAAVAALPPVIVTNNSGSVTTMPRNVVNPYTTTTVIPDPTPLQTPGPIVGLQVPSPGVVVPAVPAVSAGAGSNGPLIALAAALGLYFFLKG